MSVINFYDWIGFHASHRPDSLAFYCAESARGISYRETDARIDALACFLKDRGIMPGDRVMLVSRTTFEAFETQFACARLGAIFMPVNWRLSIPEIIDVAKDGEPSAILFQDEFIPAAKAIMAALPCTPILLGDRPEEGFPQYESITATPPDPGFRRQTVDWESTWILLYTSGTTGKPKGAMLSYRMMYFNALNFVPVSDLSSDTVFLCCMPTFHTGGLGCYANPVLYCGGTVVTLGNFDAERALGLMLDPQLRISHMFGVPVMYSLISELDAFQDAQFPALRNAGVGGAPASETLVDRWLAKDVPMQPAYGMTEIGPAIAVSNVKRLKGKLRSVGEPVMNAEIRIVDDDNHEVARGEIGELQVRGPVLLSGYWNDPERTAEAFVDGWFRTGDAARMDADGFLYIVDRYKDMFISGGENVYPAEVENALVKHPAVLRAAVVGIADERWGETGRAHVVVKPGASVDAAQLQSHLARLLAAYKVPKVFVFMAELPQTASGKVKKHDLRQL